MMAPAKMTLAVLAALVACTAAQNACVITPDGAANGDCDSAVTNLDILGSDDACNEGTTPVAISADILQAVVAVQTATSVRICGVEFEDDVNHTMATYLPALASVQGDVTISNNANLAVASLPALWSVEGSLVVAANDATMVLLPLLANLNESLQITNNPDLTAFSANVLSSVPGYVLVHDNANLAAVDLAGVQSIGQASGPAYVDTTGLSYSLHVRDNELLNDLCNISPDVFGYGVFVCNTNQTEMQIREQLADAVPYTGCNALTLARDDTCPCAYARSDPKQCKGGDGPPKPGFGPHAGPAASFSVAMLVVAAAGFMWYRRREYRRRVYDQIIIGQPTDRTPLYAQNNPAAEVPPAYAAEVGAASSATMTSKPAGTAPPVYQSM